MGIKDEIFDEFFKKLENDEKISVDTVQELKKLIEMGNINSQKEILEIIQRGRENVTYDQKN